MKKTTNTVTVLGTALALMICGAMTACSIQDTNGAENTAAARQAEAGCSSPFCFSNTMSAEVKNTAARLLIDSLQFSGSGKEVSKLKSQIYLSVNSQGMSENDAQTVLHTTFWQSANDDGKVDSGEKAAIVNCVNALAAQNNINAEVY